MRENIEFEFEFQKMTRTILLPVLLTLLTSSLSQAYVDTYSESVRFKGLPNGAVHVHFDFVVRDEGLSNHSRYFPRALAEILSAHHVQELHSTLTQGYWRLESWGEPSESVPTGALVWSWFSSPDQGAANSNWKGLTSRLSGLTCASLNFLDETTSIQPHFAYRPQGMVTPKSPNDSLNLRVGALPREHICTENLTPWTKLLPCGISRGLSSLLRSKQVFNSLFHSEGIHYVQKGPDEVELRLTLSLVVEKPTSFKPTDSLVRKILGSMAIFPCVPSSKTNVQIWKGGKWVNYDPLELNSIPITELPDWNPQEKMDIIFTPMKYIGGYGQEYGDMVVEMRNHLDLPLPVLYVETLPWYIRPYLHTIKIELTGPDGEKSTINHGDMFHYTPGRDRKALHKLEMNLLLPPLSFATLSLMVEKRHLKWDEFQPDANHGFYVPAALFQVNVTGEKEPHVYYSRILLVNLSTPDFSMPYNVICLTCTVVALAFGPIHNITTKGLRLTLVKDEEKKGVLAKVKAALRKVWAGMRRIFGLKPLPTLQAEEMTKEGEGEASEVAEGEAEEEEQAEEILEKSEGGSGDAGEVGEVSGSPKKFKEWRSNESKSSFSDQESTISSTSSRPSRSSPRGKKGF